MEYLLILFITIAIVGGLLQGLLYKSDKFKNSNTVLILNGLLSVLISYMSFTALPTNYTGKRLLALFWGILALIGIFLKIKNNKENNIYKLIISISLIGGFIQLII